MDWELFIEYLSWLLRAYWLPIAAIVALVVIDALDRRRTARRRASRRPTFHRFTRSK